MQIDFHHGATYVIARYAGFGHREADIVAYCAQYVDDATNQGEVCFNNGAMYSRISSAHKMVDYRNFEKLANHHVWIPFHFLPGNGQKRAGENPDGTFIEKIVCKPGSPVARDMVRECILKRDSLNALHRLGVTMHVFADTWAHQGFAGVNHQVNDIRALDDNDQPDADFMGRLKDFFGDAFDEATSTFVGNALPLGHGAALSFPDRPYLKWSYIDHAGQKVSRDNTAIFVDAAENMCRAMQQFRVGNPDAEVPGLPDDGRDRIEHLLKTIVSENGEERHMEWLDRINRGYFGFPPVRLDYRAKGLNSWKQEALGTRKKKDKKNETFPYHWAFLGSDWKLFHDALMAHRYTVIRDILPRYGICAA